MKGIPISLSNSIATSGIEEIEHPFCFQVYDGLKNSNEPLTLYQPYLTLDSCFSNNSYVENLYSIKILMKADASFSDFRSEKKCLNTTRNVNCFENEYECVLQTLLKS